MSWSAEQYVKFETERNRPVVDLLAHVPRFNPAYPDGSVLLSFPRLFILFSRGK